MNPIDYKSGKPMECNVCHSVFHFRRDCPDAFKGRRRGFARNSNNKMNPIYYTHNDCVHSVPKNKGKDIINNVLQCDVKGAKSGNSLSYAIFDTGCPGDVSGVVWAEEFLNCLDASLRSKVQNYPSNKKYRFGDGKIYDALYTLKLPIMISSIIVFIYVDIVQCDIPLLIGRKTMNGNSLSIL